MYRSTRLTKEKEKKALRTIVVVILSSVIFASVTLPTEGTYQLEKNDNATFVNILRPVFAVPIIAQKGDYFIIETKCDGSRGSDWNITISTKHVSYSLILNDVTQSANQQSLNVSTSLTVMEGMYDLTVKVDNVSDTELHAIYVVESFRDEFSFIHLTDIHIGAPNADENFRRAIQEINLIRPEFVIISGDITENGIETEYTSFVNYLSSLDVSAYIICGNHDYDESIASYHRIVNPYSNFSFDYGKYHFIGLDSGKNVAPYGMPGCMMGTGLTGEQIEWLKEDLNLHLNSKQKFIFMHHTALDPDGKDLWGFNWNTSISQNQHAFLTICREYNVSICFTGHTHLDEVWDRNGIKQIGSTISEPSFPLYVQTRSVGKGDTLGYRLVRINNTAIESYTYDGDCNGIRDANTSLPLGQLSVMYTQTNVGGYNVIIAEIVNNLRENLTNLFLEFNAPRTPDNRSYIIINGSIEQEINLSTSTIYYIRTNVPALSSKYVKVMQNVPPKASFLYSAINCTTLAEIYFRDNSKDFDGIIVSWYWEFGDGNISTGTSPSHRYKCNGIYNISLTVTDNAGERDVASHKIAILNLAPVATFDYFPPYPTTSDTINFTDRSVDYDGKILLWYWEFGDGETSTEKNTTHRYAARGLYTVKLCVMDDNGIVSTRIVLLNISSSATEQNLSGKPQRENLLLTPNVILLITIPYIALIVCAYIILLKRKT